MSTKPAHPKVARHTLHYIVIGTGESLVARGKVEGQFPGDGDEITAICDQVAAVMSRHGYTVEPMFTEMPEESKGNFSMCDPHDTTGDSFVQVWFADDPTDASLIYVDDRKKENREYLREAARIFATATVEYDIEMSGLETLSVAEKSATEKYGADHDAIQWIRRVKGEAQENTDRARDDMYCAWSELQSAIEKVQGL